MQSLSDIKRLMYKIDDSYRQYTMLTEGLSQILYHFTSIQNGFEICKSDVIYLQSAYAKDADNYDKYRKFYLSCTRIRSARFGYSSKFMHGGARIVMDGDLLSQTLKGRQVNYWGGGVFNDKFKYYETMPQDTETQERKRQANMRYYKAMHPEATQQEIEDYVSKHFDQERQFHTGNESEDRIFSYQPLIQNAHRVIKSIDFFMPDLDNNEEFKEIAVSLTRTNLRSLVRIFITEKDFNNPHGKPIDIWKKIEEWGYPQYKYNGNMRDEIPKQDLLKTVLLFIVSGNQNFEGKKFGQQVAELLNKYNLSEYTSIIGEIKQEIQRQPIQYISDHLDSIRRDLSDRPNAFTSKVVKMLTDYCLSIGANSFREAVKIKQKLGNDTYNKSLGRHPKEFYEGMNVDSVDFLVVQTGWRTIIIPNPSKDKFVDILPEDVDVKSMADELSNEIMEYSDYAPEGGYQHSRSKNTNAMFHFLSKLIRKGSVQEVIETLKKIGITNEYLENTYGFHFTKKNISWFDTWNYDTVTTNRLRQNGSTNERQLTYIKEEELIDFYKR